MTDGARGGENDRPGREGVAVLAGVVGGGGAPRGGGLCAEGGGERTMQIASRRESQGRDQHLRWTVLDMSEEHKEAKVTGEVSRGRGAVERKRSGEWK